MILKPFIKTSPYIEAEKALMRAVKGGAVPLGKKGVGYFLLALRIRDEQFCRDFAALCDTVLTEHMEQQADREIDTELTELRALLEEPPLGCVCPPDSDLPYGCDCVEILVSQA